MIFRAAIFLAGAALGAEPLVTGFERFHAATPTAEGGRLLYNELGCANCHGGATGLPAMRGPALATVTQRVRSEWLRKFIADPASVHPGTVMPQVLAKADDKTLVAIEHYLASLKPKTASKGPAKIMHVNGARGGELFNTLGCVACHAPGKGFVPPDGLPKASEFTHRSVGFGDLKAKYSLDSLASFIVDPLKVRTDGRMPKTTMVKQDAIDIAGYLLEFQGSDGRTDVPVVSLAADKNLAIAGRKAVIAAQCAACHDLPKDAVAQPVALEKTEGGCLDADHAKGPRYALSEAQRVALKLFLAKRDEAAPPKLAADLTLHALNCVACHERDGKGGPDAGRKPYFQGDHNLGDTGRYPPPLTGVGGKLRPEWLANVLTERPAAKGADLFTTHYSGEPYRIRPYLKTKMPHYGPAVADLAQVIDGDQAVAVAVEGEADVGVARAHLLLELLREHGFTEIMVNVSHLAEEIENYFRDGQRFGVEIAYSFEGRIEDGELIGDAMGSAGGLKKIQNFQRFFDDTDDTSIPPRGLAHFTSSASRFGDVETFLAKGCILFELRQGKRQIVRDIIRGAEKIER